MTLRNEPSGSAHHGDDLRPHARDLGGYVNFMSEFEQDHPRRVRPDEVRPAAAKREYDPENVFHHSANIVPADAPG